MNTSFPRRFGLRGQVLTVFALCAINFFVNNQYLYPTIMEARNLITAREMIAKGNWLSPTMNDYPRLAKPPLPTWINAAVGKAVGLDSLVVNRVPGAIAGTALVLLVFWVGWLLWRDPLVPFVAACVASTSFYILFLARQATWDIYCHAFMLAAIGLLITCWRAREVSLGRYAPVAVLMSLSFLSKGPVAFFALLVPFLLSWALFADGFSWRREWRGLALCTLLTVVLSGSWPAYVIATNAEALAQTLATEVDSWSNRHVRPWYQFWNFPVQAGIWAPVLFAALVYPYARRRVVGEHYRFVLGWTVFTVILLSIPAEKKERYLLPVLIPLALLGGQYLVGLYRAAHAGGLLRVDRIVIRGTGGLYAAASLAVPVALYLYGLRSWLLVTAVVLFWGLAILFAMSSWSLDLRALFVATCLLMSGVSLVALPALPVVYYTNARYRPLQELQSAPFYDKPFYGSSINPMQIWDLGKSVDTLDIDDNDVITLPPADHFVMLTRTVVDASDFRPGPPASFVLRDSLWYEPRRETQVFYVYEVRR